MIRRNLPLFLGALLTILSSVRAEDAPAFSADQVAFFETKVRPVLADHCLKCHGPTKQSGALRLDSRAEVLEGGENGPAVAPGNPDASLLIQAVRKTHEDIKMPPKGKLPDAAIEALSAWVKMGVPWPKDLPKNAGTYGDAARNHWAFRPIAAPAVPSVKEAGRVRTPIDAFILARLEKEGIAPSDEADRRTLIRRLSFDLTGLPPTAQEVSAFVSDTRADAYERLVDRLLDSPHYGERWARHWLDVARYADSKGYVFQEERRYPFAYTYRDYVIRSFNKDKPYDQFLIEQIAADRVPNSDPSNLAAMGFLTVGRRFLNSREEIIDDRIDVVCRGMLGLTVACARCHDHKFDPIPTDDYYSLFGVFDSSKEPADLPEIPGDVSDALRADFDKAVGGKQKTLEDFQKSKLDEIQADIAEHAAGYLKAAQELNFEGRNAKLDERAKAAKVVSSRLRVVSQRWKTALDNTRGKPHPIYGAWHAFAAISGPEFSRKAPSVAHGLEGDPAVCNPVIAKSFADKPPGSMSEVAERYGALVTEDEHLWQAAQKTGAKALTDPGWEQLRSVLHHENGPLAIKAENLGRMLAKDERNKLNKLTSEVAAIRASHPGSPPRAMVMNDLPTPVEPHVFLRGNAGRPGKQVPRQFLGFITGPDRKPFKNGSGRLDLAEAIASKTNPLTARVLVNRVWLNHFGAGFVDTPSDFGTRSDPPTHPELLDWLATDFMNHGWSLKHLHRQIVLSSTYRQQSLDRPDAKAKDSENRLVWKYNRRRLEFEAVRDALLAASGVLDPSVGGRPVALADPPFVPRRTIYGFIDRQNLDPMYRTFDFASPDASSPRRFVTTVPQQALFLMNSPFVLQQAKSLAALPDVNSGSPESRVDHYYERLFGRPPTTGEREAALAFLKAQAAAPPSPKGLNAWQEYAQVLLLTNEFVFVD